MLSQLLAPFLIEKKKEKSIIICDRNDTAAKKGSINASQVVDPKKVNQESSSKIYIK